MICYWYFYKKILFFILGVAQADLFLVAERAIFRGFIISFQNCWILIESLLLILIGSLNIFHWKSAKKEKWVLSNVKKRNIETRIINTLFSGFAWGKHSETKSSAYRDTLVEIYNQYSKKYHIWRKLGQNSPILGNKWQKMIIFKGFYFS